MPIKVILNPSADLGNGIEHLGPISEALGSEEASEIVLTEGPDHARKLTLAALNDGYELVVAAGGDGTVNEVVNGFMEAETNHARLGVIPIGTGNDFAHAMAIPGDVASAVHTLFRNRTRRVDLGLMEDDQGRRRYFENNLGVGFDANVVIRTAEITQVHGFLKYFIGVLTTLARDFRPLPLHMRFDQEELEQELLFVSFGVGPRHGGGFLLTPTASHVDDLIDSCAVTMLSRLRALSLLNSAIKGTHVDTPYVTIRHNKQIVIRSAEPMPIHIDGEIYAVPADGVHQIQLTSLPAAIEVLV